MYALKGGAEGLAESFKAEDKLRAEQTSKTYDTALANFKQLEKNRQDMDAIIKKEEKAVQALKGIALPDGKLLTEAEARAVYQASERLGISIDDVITKYKVETPDPEAVEITETGGVTRKVISDVDGTQLASTDDDPLIATGRYEQVDADTRRLLRAANIPTEVTMPRAKQVKGVKISPIYDTDVNFSDAYVIGDDGIPTEQVTVKRTHNKQSGKVDIEYISKSTGKPVKILQNQRVATSAEAFDKKTFIDFGPLVTVTPDGGSEPMLDSNGNIMYGYLMRNGEIRARRAGTISDEVVTDALVAGKDWAPSIAAGDLSEQKKFEKLPSVVDFSKEAQELRTAKQNNDLLFSRSQRRLDLHKKYGDRMYGPAGTFADFVTGTSKFVDGVVTIVNGLEELSNSDASLEEKIQFLESGGNIQELRSIADQRDTFLDKYIGTAQEISMARVLDAALATVTAYDLAKQTGDTRISNNDFDQYIKTVSGNNASQTVNLIKQGLESNLVIYTSKHETFTIAKESIPQYLDQKFLADIDRRYNLYDTPRVYENRLKTMFKPFEEVSAEVPQIKTDDFEVGPIETDKQGVRTRKVVMKDGTEFILRNPRFLGADEETIRQAIQKRLEAQKAANQ